MSRADGGDLEKRLQEDSTSAVNTSLAHKLREYQKERGKGNPSTCKLWGLPFGFLEEVFRTSGIQAEEEEQEEGIEDTDGGVLKNLLP